jgi:hypothetical protein
VAERLVLPGIDDEAATPTPAPETIDGRFSFPEVTIVEGGQGFYLPYDRSGNPLSPMETGTDVVLPIVAQAKGKLGRHHAHFYKSHYLAGNMGERAVRFSRLQKVGFNAHRTFHRKYRGTMMPRDEAAACRTAILNSAGYIANTGVKIEDGEVYVEELTERERVALSKPRVFSLERQGESQAEIGKFLMHYALKQGFDKGMQRTVEEFLELTPRKMAYKAKLRRRKLELGLELADAAIEVAVGHVEPDYREAYSNQALRRDSPRTAWQRAKDLINGHEEDYLIDLEDRLIDRYALTG